MKKVKEVPATSLNNMYRAGIVLYKKKKKTIYFWFGIDKKSGDISDFGGRKIKKDTNIIETAIREFNEESLGDYESFLSLEDVMESNCVYSERVMIIFVNVKGSMEKYNNKFKEILGITKDSEMSKVSWYCFDTILKLVNSEKGPSEKMYSLIKDIINKDLDSFKETFT